MITEDALLPPLREDLKIYPGPSAPEGYPTWTIYDPTCNRYFRIGWKEFEILSRWVLCYPRKIIAAITQETTLSVNLNDFDILLHFLENNNLFLHATEKSADALYKKNQNNKKSLLKKFLYNYLFFRIPLIKPDHFLKTTLPLVKPLFTKWFLYVLLALIIISLYLVSQQWTRFTTTFMHFFNWQGMLYYAIALTFVKIFHELGHAYTARYYGCRVTTMGVAFLVMWPVLYTDVTDAWRLTSRHQQAAINAAGIITELAIASIALFLWAFTTTGFLQSICFLIATASWIMTIAINLNPMMRFDGYYLLADLWGVNNLQHQSFALGKWQLRKWFFGFDDKPPYLCANKKRRLLIFYAYCTWIYRFILYLSIALLIYYLFFKVLGILLMLAEIILLLIAPIFKEIKVYYQRRSEIHFNKNTIITSLVLLALLFILVIPWQTHIDAPALLRYQQENKIYAIQPSRRVKLYVHNNQLVSSQQNLLLLKSAQLNFDIRQVLLDIHMIRYKINRDLQLKNDLGHELSDKKELASLQSKYKALVEKRHKLHVVAPFSGKIVYIADNLNHKDWVSQDRLLFELINPKVTFVEAYIKAGDLHRITIGGHGTFYPSDKHYATSMTIEDIDKTNIKKLSEAYLSSEAGGEIPVLKNEKGHLVPQISMYRVILTMDHPIAIHHITPGYVELQATARSPLSEIYKSISRVLVHESGF